jgi:pimeloyl-ACP methyl ester carboxylesterase
MLSYHDRMDISYTDQGAGRPVLVLHGGGGPATVASLAGHLAAASRVLAPTHPGWNGVARPELIATVSDLANEYLAWLDREDLADVVVIGSSIGGWVAAEMALADRSHRITGLVIVNAAGVDVPGQPIRNIAGLDPLQIAQYSFHDPATFRAGQPAPTPQSIAMQRANQQSLAALAGDPYMHDPTLLVRLAGIGIPTLVVWGESDRVVTAEYGRAYAAAIPGSRFELVPEAGHLPHLERPAETFALIDAFLG